MQIWTGQVLMNGAIQTFATKTFAMMARSAVRNGRIPMAVLYQEIIRNIYVVTFSLVPSEYAQNMSRRRQLQQRRRQQHQQRRRQQQVYVIHVYLIRYTLHIYNEPYLRLSHAIIYSSIFSNS